MSRFCQIEWMEVKETVIRLMTRLAIEHNAVNLSQGFTDEPPVYDMVWGAVAASLGGTPEGESELEDITVREALGRLDNAGESALDVSLRDLLAVLQSPRDQFNQYSFPFGMPELRRAIADYTYRFLGFTPDENEEITVVLGASEGMAATFRAFFEPGDAVIVIQPFHEIYPAQLEIFGLEPRFVTLREDVAAGTWRLDMAALRRLAADEKVKGLIFNAPHNPTGKVFSDEELADVASVCVDNDLLVITDEIYEHMTFDGLEHRSLYTFEGMADRSALVNSISKTGRATGWRVGWVIAPPERTKRIRAIHDNLAVQAPSPLQRGAVRLLSQDTSFFRGIAAHYGEKRAELMAGLTAVGFRVSPPQGAYYLFADYSEVASLRDLAPTEAAMKLIQTYGVACVPGDNFYRIGKDGEKYLRFAFCRGTETLQEGVRRLALL